MTPRCRAPSLCLLISLLALAAVQAAGTRTVDSLLRDLKPLGIVVIYSTDLVPADLQAPPPKPGRTPLELAMDALAANGLKLESLAPQKYVVVRVPAPTVAPAPEPGPMQEISVYASRYSMDGRTLNDPRALSSGDIDAVPGAHDDALRALKSLPGLASNASGRPYIRGSLADDVLVRYDGVTLLDPFHLKNYQSLISAIDPAAVERIEVFSGGFPVRYGTRSGGVIDITPPSHGPGYENRAAISLISGGLSSTGSAESLPLDWVVAIRRSTLDLLDPVEDSFGQPQFSDSLGRLRYRTENGAWTAGWLLLDDRIELNKNDNEESSNARYRDEYFWLARDHEFSPRLRTRVTAVLTSAERHRDGVLREPGVATGDLQDDQEFDRIELTNLWTWDRREDVTDTFGLEAASSSSEYDYQRTARYDPAVAAAFARPVTNDLRYAANPKVFTYALHAAERRRWQDFEAELGVRLDGENYSLGGGHNQVSPRLNLRYDFDDRMRMYASVGRFSQAQHVEEWRAEEAQPVADPAQVALHTILGLTYEAANSLRWGLEAYTKRWTTVSPYLDSELNPLSLTPDLAPDRIRINPTRSEASGIEFNLRREISPALSAWGTLSWARVSDEVAGDDIPRSWDQPLAMTAGIAWQGPRFNLSAFGSWHRGWPRTHVDFAQPPFAQADVPIVLGQRNADRWGDFYTLDLRASYLWPLRYADFSVVLEATNAADRQNECCALLRATGAGGFDQELDHWLPAIVNLGFTYRWRSRD